MALKVIEYPDPRLRKPAERVSIRDPDERTRVRAIAAELAWLLTERNLLSVHAIQVELECPLDLFVIHIPDESKLPMTFVNARMQGQRGMPTVGRERCASFPSCSVQVPRTPYVTISRSNEHGQPDTREWGGWTARLIQHELEHSQGRLMYDSRDKDVMLRVLRRRKGLPTT